MPLTEIPEHTLSKYFGIWKIEDEESGTTRGTIIVTRKRTVVWVHPDGTSERMHLKKFDYHTSWVGCYGFKTAKLSHSRLREKYWIPKLLPGGDIRWTCSPAYYDDPPLGNEWFVTDRDVDRSVIWKKK